MASFDGQLPRLEGLLALSRTEGVDVRPTLLRVLTDLFVSAREPTADDAVRYIELVGHLISQVDTETLVVVAEKLARSPHAPRVILERLMAEGPEVASPILSHAPGLTADDLWPLITSGDAATLTAIAARPDLDAAQVEAIAARHMPAAAVALAGNARAPIDRQAIDRLINDPETREVVAERLARRSDIDLAALAPLLPDLPAPDRRRVIAAFLAEPARRLPGRDTRIEAPALVLEAIEAAALTGEIDHFDRQLAGLFGVEPARIEPLAAAPDLLALCLTAAGMPPDQAIRVLMFASPGAGRSVGAVRELDDLLQETNRAAATRIVRAALGLGSPVSTGRHSPILVDSERPRRGEGVAATPAADQTRERRGSGTA